MINFGSNTKFFKCLQGQIKISCFCNKTISASQSCDGPVQLHKMEEKGRSQGYVVHLKMPEIDADHLVFLFPKKKPLISSKFLRQFAFLLHLEMCHLSI